MLSSTDPLNFQRSRRRLLTLTRRALAGWFVQSQARFDHNSTINAEAAYAQLNAGGRRPTVPPDDYLVGNSP
jgi:hypothetical protein